MKNKILSKAYGGVMEARHRLYGLGLPRQWKVITSTLLLLFTFAIGNVWAADITVVPTLGQNVNTLPYGLFTISHSSTKEDSKISSGAIAANTKNDVITINFKTTKSDMYIKSVTFSSLSNGTLSSSDGTISSNTFTVSGNKSDVNVVLTSNSNAKGTVKITNVVVNTGTNTVETITFNSFDGTAKTFGFTSSAGASSSLTSISSNNSNSVSSNILTWSNGRTLVFAASGKIKYAAFVMNDGKAYTGVSADKGTYVDNYSWTGDVETLTLTNGIGSGRTIKNFYLIIAPATKHHVTYSLGGDYGTTPTQADVAEGGKFTLHNGTTGITAPENKTFAGWNDGTTTYEGGAEYTMGEDDVTLTAQWATSYDISYDKGTYGTGEIAGGKKAEDVAYTLSSSMFTRENYLQVGWATTDGASRSYMMGGSYTTNAAQTFYPAWAEKDTYVAAFHYDSENPTTPPAGWTFANAGTYTNTSATVAYVGKFTAEGETTASGKGMDPNHIAFAKNADADAVYDLGYVTTVSAVAGTLMIGSTSAKVASIDYLAADGTTVLHSFNITHNKTDWGANNFNETEVVPNVRYIRINGKDFWQVLGAFSVTYGSLVTKYDLTFAKNGGSGDDMATLRYAEDALVTLPGCTFTAPTNKTFDAWVVTKTASGNPITVTDGKFTMPAEAVTATATWKFLPKLTLTAGEGATGEDVVAYYAAGTQISVPEKPAGFSNGTKEFTGWVYSQAVTIEADKFAMPSTDLTLTAQWASATAVAQILGGDSYETFAEAIAAVAAGQTIQLLADCSYDAAWNLTLAGTVTLDLNGHDLTYTGSGRGVQVHNGAKLVLEDGTATVAPTIDLTADPLSRSAITYTSGTFDSKDGMCALAGGEIEINSGTYLATEGVILVKGNGATATVNDGVLISRDNGVLMGNGTNSADFRNYVINVHGGILLGEIVSTGYASMVIYHPNVGELNIDGGTLVSTNGPAVVCRGGESNITGGTIIAQGSGSGKCGDASLVLQAVGVAYDFKSAYPGVSSFDAKISGDANVSGAAGAVQGIYAGATPTTAEKDAVAISGGTFNSPVAEALCAENYAPKDNGDGTYGVKPLAVTFDIEAYVVSTTEPTIQQVRDSLTAVGYTYSNIANVDRGHTHNYIYDGIKWSNANDGYIQFETAADKLVIVKTGRMQSDASAKMSVNGVESATVIESADESKETHKLYYWYNAGAALYKLDIKSKTTGGTCVLKAITITDPYEVSYNTHGGDLIAAQYFYGTALTLPTPTYGTQSFKGWYDAETGGNLIGAAGASYTPTGNIELHAQWETVSTVNTLSDLKVDGATIDGFDPATNIYNLVYEYGQQPVITSATATSSVAEVTINNTPVDEGTYKYVQVKVVPESGEADQKFYQVRYTNKLKRGVEIIKVETTGGNNKTVSGLYAGDGDVNLSTGGNARKMDNGKFIGFILDGTTLAAGDIVNVHTSAAATTGGSHIIFYDNMTDKNELYETGEIGGTGDNLFVINAAMEGSTTAYVYRSNADAAHQWNGFVDYLSAERYMAPFIEEFKIGEAIGTIDKINKTIAVEVPYGTDVTALTPVIAAYANGGATLDKTGAQDFSSPVTYKVSSAYAEDGDVTYTVTVTVADHYEAMIVGGASYSTLVAAVAAAQAGDVVKLLDNVDLMATGLTIAKNMTLDLNGFNIKAGERETNDIIVPAGVKLTLVDNSTDADGKIYTEEEYAGSATGYGLVRVSGELLMQSGNIYAVIDSDPANLGQFAVVLGAGGKATIEGGQIKAGWYAISNNGNNTGSTIIVSGGELISTADYAIYNPAKESTVTVSGGVVYGAAGGIAMNRGELTVTGGTITSKDQGTTGTWGDGTGGLSNAAISANGKYESVSVEISGGTVIAEGSAIMITNGTVNPVEVAISGGQFSHVVPEAYCAKDFIPVTTPNAQGKYEVIAAGIIRAAATDAGIVWTCNLDNGVVIYSSESDGRLKDATMTSTSSDVTACGGAEGGYNVNQSKFLLKFPVNVKEFTLYAANNTARTINNIYVNDEASADIKISTVGDELTGTYTYTKDGKCQTMTAVFDDANIIPANYYVLVVLSGANIYRVLYTEAECTTPTVTVADQTAKDGVAVNLIAEASALGATYQWYTCEDALGTNPVIMPGKTAKTLSVTKSGADDQFYKVVVGCNCSEETAAAVAKVSLYTAVTTLVDVTENTIWDWSTIVNDVDGVAIGSDGKKVNGANGILANYIQGTNMDKIESNNGAYAIRSNSYQYYQGASLHMHTTKAGMLKIHARSDGSAMKLIVAGIDMGSMTSTFKDYVVYIPAGDVVIYNVPETDGKPMRIDHMTFTVKESPDYTRDQMLGAGVYGTICVPYNVPAGGIHGITVYELMGREPQYGKLAFDEIIEMEAGVPYVFQAHGDELALFYGETSVANPVNKGNGMYGTFTDQVLTDLNDVYYFAQKALWGCADLTSLNVPANRAYVKLSEVDPVADPNPAPGRRRISMAVNGEQIATGIENTGFESEAPRKVLINGELYIIRGEKMYDAKGQLVK